MKTFDFYGQHILIVLEGTRDRPRGVYLRKDPNELLNF